MTGCMYSCLIIDLIVSLLLLSDIHLMPNNLVFNRTEIQRIHNSLEKNRLWKDAHVEVSVGSHFNGLDLNSFADGLHMFIHEMTRKEIP